MKEHFYFIFRWDDNIIIISFDSFSLESEWQQDSLSFQDSSQYFVRSQ